MSLMLSSPFFSLFLLFLLTFMSSCGSYLSLLFLSPFTSLLPFVFCVLHGVLSLLYASWAISLNLSLVSILFLLSLLPPFFSFLFLCVFGSLFLYFFVSFIFYLFHFLLFPSFSFFFFLCLNSYVLPYFFLSFFFSFLPSLFSSS